MIVPTVAIRHPLNPSVMMIINESDLTDDHVLWDEGVTADLRVGKGPRGKWYVLRGHERIAGPFETEAEAEDAATKA